LHRFRDKNLIAGRLCFEGILVQVAPPHKLSAAFSFTKIGLSCHRCKENLGTVLVWGYFFLRKNIISNPTSNFFPHPTPSFLLLFNKKQIFMKNFYYH